MGAAGHRADLEAGELAVDFEGREVIYDVGELDELVQGEADEATVVEAGRVAQTERCE